MSVFVSIASYCDPVLRFTLARAVAAARWPDRLHFGIVDQSSPPLPVATPAGVSPARLSYLRIDSTAGELTHDLAVDASGRDRPSPVAAGLAVPTGLAGEAQGPPAGPAGLLGPWLWPAVGLAVTAALAGLVLARRGRSTSR